MPELLTALVDLVFPPSNHQLLLRDLGPAGKLPTGAGLYQDIYYLSRYSEPVVQAAILENKFHHRKRAAELLGQLFETWVQGRTEPLLFIPIPLGAKRRRSRGHNQVESILRQVKAPIQIRLDIISRPVETKPQSQLHKSDRESNLDRAFKCHPEKLVGLAGVNIVLVDDVVTTGATLVAARAELAAHLPPTSTLTCLALAH